MPKLSTLTDAAAVQKALAEYDELGQDKFLARYSFGPARNYILQYKGRPYDSKAIFGAAFGYQHGKPLKSTDFPGGERTVKRILEKLGFNVVTKDLIRPAEFFQPNRVYNRRRDIHSTYGGQEQGGISTPSGVPVVFLFTGESGNRFGYEDDWTDDGVYLYTGEGQLGDMRFVGGNAAIRNHVQDGKDLLLFQSLGKGKGHRYLGVFVCNSWEFDKRPDRTEKEREAIVFHLAPVEIQTGQDATHSNKDISLEELRKRAYKAATPTSSTRQGAGRQYRERAEAVRKYVLARAEGTCEACQKPAPFSRKDGTPYLEPHHIKRLADEGPDDPRWVAAICPTCHRRVHHGADGIDWNARLLDVIKKKEQCA